MNIPLPVQNRVRFHLSLNVTNLNEAVEFYQKVFGMPPAKHRLDYAKFELEDPPVVLSLEPIRHTHTAPSEAQGENASQAHPAHGQLPYGALNHLGFRLSSSTELVDMQRRLELLGIRSQREEGVECCYARQTKFWLHDPDQTLWEVYTLDEDIEHRGIGQEMSAILPESEGDKPHPLPTAKPIPAKTIESALPSDLISWQHRIIDPFPMPIPIENAKCKEVILAGTFNQIQALHQIESVLSEVNRILAPGGRLFIHVLTSPQNRVTNPILPGPAAVVQITPSQEEVSNLVVKHGFHALRFLKYDAKPCFVSSGTPLRELQLEAWKDSEVKANAAMCQVLYKGPYSAINLSNNLILQQGKWYHLPIAIVQDFQKHGNNESLLMIPEEV